MKKTEAQIDLGGHGTTLNTKYKPPTHTKHPRHLKKMQQQRHKYREIKTKKTKLI